LTLQLSTVALMWPATSVRSQAAEHARSGDLDASGRLR